MPDTVHLVIRFPFLQVPFDGSKHPVDVLGVYDLLPSLQTPRKRPRGITEQFVDVAGPVEVTAGNVPLEDHVGQALGGDPETPLHPLALGDLTLEPFIDGR